MTATTSAPSAHIDWHCPRFDRRRRYQHRRSVRHLHCPDHRFESSYRGPRLRLRLSPTLTVMSAVTTYDGVPVAQLLRRAGVPLGKQLLVALF